MRGGSGAKRVRITVKTRGREQSLATLDGASDAMSDIGRKRGLSPSKEDASTVASVKTRRTSLGENPSPSDRLQGNCRKYIEVLDLPQMLGSGSWGNHLHQAQRVLRGLQNLDETSEECVSLQAHITLAQECLKVSSPKLVSLSKAEREHALALVMPSIVAREIPTTFRCALLSRIVKENTLSSDVEIEQWLDAINPHKGTYDLRLDFDTVFLFQSRSACCSCNYCSLFSVFTLL